MKIERRRRGRGAEVYTSSLNDIMFFLMLFFLIVSTMVTPMAIRVMLPRASTSKPVTPKDNISLSITRDKHYFINDREVPFSQIEPTLAQMTAGIPDDQKPNVLLQADLALDLQSVVTLIDIGNRQKLKMILFTEKDK